MTSIGIRELKAHASEIVRQVREEGAHYDVTYRGATVARLVPVDVAQPVDRAAITAWLAELDELAAEIGAHVTDGLGADEVMRGERREL